MSLEMSILIGIVSGIVAAAIVEAAVWILRLRRRKNAIALLRQEVAWFERLVDPDIQIAAGQEYAQEVVIFNQWKSYLDRCHLMLSAAMPYLSSKEIGIFAHYLFECYRLTMDRDEPHKMSFYRYTVPKLKQSLPDSRARFASLRRRPNDG